MNVSKIWHNLFLEERPSLGLSFFRPAVAITAGLHVIPSFFHLDDNYFSTALKTLNDVFFTPEVLDLVQKSSDGVVVFFVWLFCLSCFAFFIGLFSQMSCIVMTLCCYYFYALNDYHIGTLSWDILLVTLFLMCMTSYHGDYFSIDALRKKDVNAYQKPRPFFIQRLLQLQIASTFFYTALYKISVLGNWLQSNPIYYLMNYPPQGVTKNFLLKEWMAVQPGFCYWTGILIIVIELAMPFLLFYSKTRRSAIMLGFFFHVLLLLTLDVPAIFFFLFPAQLLLFIHPQVLVDWIKRKRAVNALSPRYKIIYDGHCGFCQKSVEQLKVMDLFGRCEYVADQTSPNQLYLTTPDGKSYGGFYAFRQMAWELPMLYPMLLLFYLPGAGWIGSALYRFIAKNRFCANKQCVRP